MHIKVKVRYEFNIFFKRLSRFAYENLPICKGINRSEDTTCFFKTSFVFSLKKKRKGKNDSHHRFVLVTGRGGDVNDGNVQAAFCFNYLHVCESNDETKHWE